MNDTILEETERRIRYERFIKTEAGMKWKKYWQVVTNSDTRGDFGDFLYDFYPEVLD